MGSKRKKPAKKKPAKFQAPFKTPAKSINQFDDFESLAVTPNTPKNEGIAKKPREQHSTLTTPNKRSIRQAAFKTPVQPNKSAKVSASEYEKYEVKDDFDSLQETPNATSSKADDDFDSLKETPATAKLCKAEETPANEVKEDFDSLGVTPASECFVKRDQEEGIDTSNGEASVLVDDINTVLNDMDSAIGAAAPSHAANGARSKRRRTQTTFFGDVMNSATVDLNANLSKKRANIEESAEESDDDDSDDSAEYSDSSKEEANTSNRLCRRNMIFTEKDLNKDRPLEPYEVPHHTAFARHRCWETDGVRAWVKPQQLPMKRNKVYTENEIAAARNLSPGPPVCPYLIRGACHGRYPPDEMGVRIGMRMRRSYHALQKKVRRNRFRRVHRDSEFLRALRLNHINRSKRNLHRAFCIIFDHGKEIRWRWNALVFLDCLDNMTEITLTQHWFPRTQELVKEFIKKVSFQVIDDMDEVKLSPLFREDFQFLQIPYTGKYVLPRGSKVRISEPGSGPPFLTVEEFRNKFRDEPPEYTDEELTRDYDNEGNVIGHFTVPTLRELLMPIGPEDEQNEDIPRQKRLEKQGEDIEADITEPYRWKNEIMGRLNKQLQLLKIANTGAISTKKDEGKKKEGSTKKRGEKKTRAREKMCQITGKHDNLRELEVARLRKVRRHHKHKENDEISKNTVEVHVNGAEAVAVRKKTAGNVSSLRIKEKSANLDEAIKSTEMDNNSLKDSEQTMEVESVPDKDAVLSENDTSAVPMHSQIDSEHGKAVPAMTIETNALPEH